MCVQEPDGVTIFPLFRSNIKDDLARKIRQTGAMENVHDGPAHLRMERSEEPGDDGLNPGYLFTVGPNLARFLSVSCMMDWLFYS